MTQRAPRPDVGEIGPAQVLEALLFAPIGFGAKLLAEAPDRYRQFRSDLVAARFIGEMAVTQGAAQLRARRAADASERIEPVRASPEAAAPAASSSTAETTRDDVAQPRPDDEPAADNVPDAGPDSDDDFEADVDSEADADVVVGADELAIPDYDSVPAIDVVGQLADLDDTERTLIRRYELANRARRTILGKLDQLQESV